MRNFLKKNLSLDFSELYGSRETGGVAKNGVFYLFIYLFYFYFHFLLLSRVVLFSVSCCVSQCIWLH